MKNNRLSNILKKAKEIAKKYVDKVKYWFNYYYEYFGEINKKVFSKLCLILSIIFLIGSFKHIVYLVFAVGSYLLHAAWRHD